MDQLACPKNTKARAASLIASKWAMKNSDLNISEIATPKRTKRLSMPNMVKIDFENCKKTHDSDSDSDATPMTRISKKVRLFWYEPNNAVFSFINKYMVNPLTTTKSIKALKKKMYRVETTRKLKRDLEHFEKYFIKTKKRYIIFMLKFHGFYKDLSLHLSWVKGRKRKRSQRSVLWRLRNQAWLREKK